MFGCCLEPWFPSTPSACWPPLTPLLSRTNRTNLFWGFPTLIPLMEPLFLAIFCVSMPKTKKPGASVQTVTVWEGDMEITPVVCSRLVCSLFCCDWSDTHVTPGERWFTVLIWNSWGKWRPVGSIPFIITGMPMVNQIDWQRVRVRFRRFVSNQHFGSSDSIWSLKPW